MNIFDWFVSLCKVKGKWEGQAYYSFSQGPRKGKRDVETWKDGELVSSKKYYGEGEGTQIKDWDDLKKLQTSTEACSASLTAENSSSPDKDVFYDCISNEWLQNRFDALD